MRADHWPPGSRINHTDHLQWEIFEHNCDTEHRADDVPKYNPEQRENKIISTEDLTKYLVETKNWNHFYFHWPVIVVSKYHLCGHGW